ncbi:MAG: HAD family hydrolase [Betaproteobacteria bacterium]
MRLALFDLDHTLLPVDSADGWSHFLVRAGGLDTAEYGARIEHFAATYRAGTFDTEAYLVFQFALLARFPRRQLEHWRTEYLRARVLPHIRAEALELIDTHRQAGDELALVTGTHSFVTAPIATAFGLPHLLAVQPATDARGEFTGGYSGTHTYGEGKVRAVEQFLGARGLGWDGVETVFYSDSINDLPLLARVTTPVATNPDARLRKIAAERGWRVLELFATEREAA